MKAAPKKYQLAKIWPGYPSQLAIMNQVLKSQVMINSKERLDAQRNVRKLVQRLEIRVLLGQESTC